MVSLVGGSQSLGRIDKSPDDFPFVVVYCPPKKTMGKKLFPTSIFKMLEGNHLMLAFLISSDLDDSGTQWFESLVLAKLGRRRLKAKPVWDCGWQATSSGGPWATI